MYVGQNEIGVLYAVGNSAKVRVAVQVIQFVRVKNSRQDAGEKVRLGVSLADSKNYCGGHLRIAAGGRYEGAQGILTDDAGGQFLMFEQGKFLERMGKGEVTKIMEEGRREERCSSFTGGPLVRAGFQKY